jgi:transposase InsO family protein
LGSLGVCDICEATKSTRLVCRAAPQAALNRLKSVYSDFKGPISPPTPSGARYILTFTNDYSRKAWVFLVKARTDLYEVFKEWRAEVERGDSKLQGIRCDNAGEYQYLERQLKLKSTGIRFEYTTPYTPEQNGVAERLNRTLITKVQRRRGQVKNRTLHTSGFSGALRTRI